MGDISRLQGFKIMPGSADIYIMRISSGLSVIQSMKINRGNAGPSKIYTWPDYNTGRVEKAEGVSRHKGSGAIYYKPPPEEFESILARGSEQMHGEYTPGGSLRLTKAPVEPGSLFEALV